MNMCSTRFQVLGEGVAVAVRTNGKTTAGRSRRHWKWTSGTGDLSGRHIDAVARTVG